MAAEEEVSEDGDRDELGRRLVTEGSLDSGVDRESLWRGLVAKALDPTSFIPAITRCEVLQQDGDELVREIEIRGERVIREAVRFEPKSRITFDQETDPFIDAIVNEVVEDRGSPLGFRLIVVLSQDAVSKEAESPGFLAELTDYFRSTHRSIVAQLNTNDW